MDKIVSDPYESGSVAGNGQRAGSVAEPARPSLKYIPRYEPVTLAVLRVYSDALDADPPWLPLSNLPYKWGDALKTRQYFLEKNNPGIIDKAISSWRARC